MSDHHWSILSLVGQWSLLEVPAPSANMLAPLLPLLWLAAARGFGNMNDGTGRAELCDVRQGRHVAVGSV